MFEWDRDVGYLLTEATPAEYAAFISAAREHPGGLRKVTSLLKLLRTRIDSRGDERSNELYEKAIDCLKEINTRKSLEILNNFWRWEKARKKAS